jgi:penicillin-insensitive murein DD-endopeptidase
VKLRKSSVLRATSLCLAALGGMFVLSEQLAHATTVPQELALQLAAHERSTSIGFPWRGRLERGLRLSDPEVIRVVPEYEPYGNFYGTWQLVQLTRRAARHVAERYPGSKLSTGELSAERGGRISGHHSHRNGRDIDIGFYLTDEAGTPAHARAFVHLRKSGKANFAGQVYYFDDARNWALLSRLVADEDARVQFVFVAESIQKRLLAQAARENASPDLIARARAVMFQPKEGNKHDSHFHVRIYCPAADQDQCRDRPPYYPWYPGQPPNGVFTASIRGIELVQ